MNNKAEPLVKKSYTHNLDIPILLVSSAVLLVFGLFLPIITFKEMVFWKHTFSILSGILSLWQETHYFLSLIILCFSVIFPFFKLITLLLLWFEPMSSVRQKTYLHWLAILGKWSMLDVFVVAITIVIAKSSNFVNADPKVGIYFFFASIVLAMWVTARMEKILKLQEKIVA